MNELYKNTKLVKQVQNKLAALIDIEYIFETETSDALLLFDIMGDIADLDIYEKISIFFDCFNAEYLTKQPIDTLKKLVNYIQGVPSSIDIPLDYPSIEEFLQDPIFAGITSEAYYFIRDNFVQYVATHLHAAYLIYTFDLQEQPIG